MSLSLPIRNRYFNQIPFSDFDADVDPFFSPFFSQNLVNRFPTKSFETKDMVTRTGNMKWDMIETPTEYKISAELPGMLKENINIDIDEGVLTISAEKEESKLDEGATYVYKERSWGNVRRSVRLPQDADDNAVSASMNNGCLHVNVAKKNEAEHSKKKIPILEKEN